MTIRPPAAELTSAVMELIGAIHALIKTARLQTQGLREELVRIEEAIRDTAPLGPRRIS